MSKSSDKPSFFVINISDKNVSLSDLALTVPKGKTYDLLNGNFSYSIEELKASMNKGSLYKKRHLLKIGKGRPQESLPPPIEISEHPIITRQRSNVKVETPKFTELFFSDEDYAQQMAELEEEND